MGPIQVFVHVFESPLTEPSQSSFKVGVFAKSWPEEALLVPVGDTASWKCLKKSILCGIDIIGVLTLFEICN